MNLPLFIAQRLQKSQSQRFSATVYHIGVASIGLCLAIMIVAFAVFFGFKRVVKQKIYSLSGQIQVKKFSRNESFEEKPLSRSVALYQTKNPENLPSISHIQAVAHKTGILKTKDDLLGVLLKGVGQDYDWQNFEMNMLSGKTLSLSDTSISNDILVSDIIANKLNLSIGNEIVMAFLQDPPRFRKLNIVGIYQTGIEEIDTQLIIGDLKLIQKLNNWGADTVGTFEIFVKENLPIEQASDQVAAMLQNDMAIELVSTRFQGLFDWLQLLDRNVAIFLGLIMLVAVFNMMSILLVMIMERSPMIGLLKALGSNNWKIRQIFVYQGIGIVIKGLLWGNVLGLGLGFVQQYYKIIPLDPANYYMSYVPIDWHWDVVLYLNLGVLLLVSLVLILPTVIITKIEPIKAIAFNK